MYKQIQSLSRKPAIIVGTPGRIIDHLNKKNLKVTTTKIVVLDEADRMLDMGFEPQLREIFKYLPQLRQTLLFSATFPKHIAALAQKYLKNPVHVSVGEAEQPVVEIKQSAIQTTESEKNKTLLNELNVREGSILIFTRTKRRTDRLSRLLQDKKHAVGRIHGGLSQAQRNRAMEQFRNNQNRILVATDLAARGLDIDHIRHVINYDLPAVPEDYVHRIGRTARAGAHGEALSILVPEDYEIWNKISHLYKINGPALPKPQGADSFRQNFGRRRRSKRHRRH